MTNFDGRTVALFLAVALAALPTTGARADATPLADTQLAQAAGVPSASPFQTTGPLTGLGRLPGAAPIYGVSPGPGGSPTIGPGARGRSGIRNSGETPSRD